MKITPQILSIPPYISTSWKNVASLHVEDQSPTPLFIVTLHSGARIKIPNLSSSMIEIIFTAHAHYLELDEKVSQSKAFPKTPLSFPMSGAQLISLELPLKNSLSEIDGLGSLLEHNNELANTPDLPPDVLEKITLLSKSMGIEDPNNIPKPEPHCNCMRCQIAKAMLAGFDENTAGQEEEEIVKDEELTFRTWDVTQSNDKLYIVTNPLDDKEHYNVYLGEPVGCTCGEKHCEHIKAVLNS